MGVELLRRWKLPPMITESLALHHHTPDQVDVLSSSAPCRLTMALAAAATIADYYNRAAKAAARARIEAVAARYYKLDGEGLDRVLAEVDNRVRQATDLFGLDVWEYPSLDEMLSQANSELAEIALRAQAASLQAGVEAQAVRVELAATRIEKEEFRQQAFRDVLTNAYNRQFFEEALERECNRSARYGTSIGMIFLDVDHFKALNDSHGHLVGDQVLKAVVQAIQSAVRESDLVARYGGEEFVVLAVHLNQADLIKTAERVRKVVESTAIHSQGNELRVTVSVGATLLHPKSGHTESHRRLIEIADQAMYTAKQLGRNQVYYRDCA